jgi:hypothetical protein
MSLVSLIWSQKARNCATWAVVCILLTGCGGQPRRLLPPDVDPDAAAAMVMDLYDGNDNGVLDPLELRACPALAGSLDKYDGDANGALTAEEIAHGIERWRSGQTGVLSLPFQVLWAGQALEGAQVRLVPEECLGDEVLPAVGTAGPGGRGFIGIEPNLLPAGAPRVPLVQPGLYRVEITHPNVSLPEKYNTHTTLGIEVASDRLSPAGVVWTLTK